MNESQKLTFRIEEDLLGKREVPADVLYGIHTLRAMENFPLSSQRIDPELIKAYGLVKLACASTNHKLGYLDSRITEPLIQACEEMVKGDLSVHIKVDPFQGGAGTSLNMNVNEVLANRTLQKLGLALGNYSVVSPYDHVNLHQSTNDTFPTALKIAALRYLGILEISLVSLQESFQEKERAFQDIVKIGRTELQDAILITLGREMGAYAEAINRDRWRVYKCEERLRVVNLGGTAVGSGLGAPRKYIFAVVDELRAISGLNLARAENLLEATQNSDVFVEVGGILSACASNIFKISNDLRLLSSGPTGGFNEIKLPECQAGSSIMPGKVNPVIPEAAAQCALMAMGYLQTLTYAVSNGQLELNHNMPLIAHCLLNAYSILINAIDTLRERCIQGIVANENQCKKTINSSTAIVTALLEKLGYSVAQELVKESVMSGLTIREIAVSKGLLTGVEFDTLVTPEAVCKLGFTK